jgi:tetratricopeptide (TPR) repeat protein
MAKRAWYARTSWTTEDRDEVFARLREVVGEHEQASCLRKQAAHLLAHAGKLSRSAPQDPQIDQLLGGARELFEAFLDWFSDSSERAYVLAALGEVEERAGAVEQALARYREALEAQDTTARSTNAHLRFGVLVVNEARFERYDDALELLERFGQPLIYPIEQYQHCGIRATILKHRGDRALALLCARDALAATKHVGVDESTLFHLSLLAITDPQSAPTLPSSLPTSHISPPTRPQS